MDTAIPCTSLHSPYGTSIRGEAHAAEACPYYRTGQDRTGQDRTGQDRTGQDRTGQDRTGQDRTAAAGRACC